MRVLKQHFRSGAELLKQLPVESLPTSMFCPTTTPLHENDEVLIEWAVPELPNRIVVRGRVRKWRAARPRLRVRAGATIEFLADEQRKVTFVRDVLEGRRPAPVRRRHTRLPIHLDVRYRTTQTAEYVPARVTELSVGGALLQIASERPIATGDDVVVELVPPGSVRPLPIAGRVAYVLDSQQAGIRFLSRDTGGVHRMREVVRRFIES